MNFFKNVAWLSAYAAMILAGFVVYTTTLPAGGGLDPRFIFSKEAVNLLCQLSWYRYCLVVVLTAGAVTILTSDKITC